MLMIASNDMYNFLMEQTKEVKNLSNKELLLCVFGGQHLQGHYDFHLGTGVAAASVGTAVAFFASNPVFLSVMATVGVAGVISACKNAYSDYKVKKLIDVFTSELLTRYDNVIEAYMQVRAMIENTEREEILDFFEKANNN
jgi:hypothetical protein